METAMRMKGLREDKDLRQADIAALLHTTQQYYSEYESGKREIPTRHIKTLCRFYNISADYLLGLSDVPKPLK